MAYIIVNSNDLESCRPPVQPSSRAYILRGTKGFWSLVKGAIQGNQQTVFERLTHKSLVFSLFFSFNIKQALLSHYYFYTFANISKEVTTLNHSTQVQQNLPPTHKANYTHWHINYMVWETHTVVQEETNNTAWSQLVSANPTHLQAQAPLKCHKT